MHSANSRTRLKAGQALGVLALASALLAACGGGSSTADSIPASSAPSPEASTDMAGPPRPTGLADAEWTEVLASLDPDAYRNSLLAKTPDELATSCESPAMTPEARQSAAENGVASYPESTVEEWTALYDYLTPAMQAVKDEICASAPAVESAPDDGAGALSSSSFDPPRPTGVSDSDWAAYLSTWDPADFEAQMTDADEEIMVAYCAKDDSTVRDETIGGLPETTAEQYPESTVEEWTAFYDYAYAGLDDVRQRLCVDY